MINLKEYILEKFKISKDIKIFSEETFLKIIKKLGVTNTAPAGEELQKWCERNDVIEFEAYDGGNFEQLLSAEKGSYIKNKEIYNKYKEELLNNGVEVENDKLGDNTCAYYTDTLFGHFSKDKTIGIIFKKI